MSFFLFIARFVTQFSFSKFENFYFMSSGSKVLMSVKLSKPISSTSILLPLFLSANYRNIWIPLNKIVWWYQIFCLKWYQITVRDIFSKFFIMVSYKGFRTYVRVCIVFRKIIWNCKDMIFDAIHCLSL